jgi:threonine dehydrogenase-like Zn-dependent dehydrogenase
MKGVVYEGPRKIAVKDVPDARIETPLGAVIRITTTNICGSDLHMYEGRTSVEEGKVLGHENMGVVEEVGGAVNRIKVGDRVSVPFNIACGTCRNLQLRMDVVLSSYEPDRRYGRRRLRLRQHGAVPRRPGGAPASALRGLQPAQAPTG